MIVKVVFFFNHWLPVAETMPRLVSMCVCVFPSFSYCIGVAHLVYEFLSEKIVLHVTVDLM